MKREPLDEMAGPPQPVAERGNEEPVGNPHQEPMVPTDVCDKPVGSNVHHRVGRLDDGAERSERGGFVDLTGAREHTTLTLREQSSAAGHGEEDEDAPQPIGNDGVGHGHATIVASVVGEDNPRWDQDRMTG